MVQGTAPLYLKQVLPTETYFAKLVDDGIDPFDVYDFKTGEKTGALEDKYWADLEIDGVEDENRPGQCFTKRLFFRLATGEKATLPKFLRGLGIPMDEQTGYFDTAPAVGKAWVVLSIVRKLNKAGKPMNVVESYVKDRSHKATDRPELLSVPVDAQGWPEEDAEGHSEEAPF